MDDDPDLSRIDYELVTLNTLIKHIAEKGLAEADEVETVHQLSVLRQCVAYLEAALYRISHKPN